MIHLIEIQEVGGKRGYIQNFENGAMFKIYCTLSFRYDGGIISQVDGYALVSV